MTPRVSMKWDYVPGAPHVPRGRWRSFSVEIWPHGNEHLARFFGPSAVRAPRGNLIESIMFERACPAPTIDVDHCLARRAAEETLQRLVDGFVDVGPEPAARDRTRYERARQTLAAAGYTITGEFPGPFDIRRGGPLLFSLSGVEGLFWLGEGVAHATELRSGSAVPSQGDKADAIWRQIALDCVAHVRGSDPATRGIVTHATLHRAAMGITARIAEYEKTYSIGQPSWDWLPDVPGSMRRRLLSCIQMCVDVVLSAPARRDPTVYWAAAFNIASAVKAEESSAGYALRDVFKAKEAGSVSGNKYIHITGRDSALGLRQVEPRPQTIVCNSCGEIFDVAQAEGRTAWRAHRRDSLHAIQQFRREIREHAFGEDWLIGRKLVLTYMPRYPKHSLDICGTIETTVVAIVVPKYACRVYEDAPRPLLATAVPYVEFDGPYGCVATSEILRVSLADLHAARGDDYSKPLRYVYTPTGKDTTFLETAIAHRIATLDATGLRQEAP